MPYNAARALGKMRKKETKNCEWCDTEMTKLRSARYCSNTCRQQVKYAKHKYLRGDDMTHLTAKQRKFIKQETEDEN